MDFKNIVFDIGGVLVDSNPRYLLKDYFNDNREMEYFLTHICTPEWNLEQDKGRSLAEGTRILQNKYPEYHALIQLFYDKYEKMLKSDIPETVALLKKLKARYKVYGLTNWSAETFKIAYAKFPFFKEFDGIVVSGQEKILKPDKRIYYRLLDRYNLKAENTVYIDDNIDNIRTAEEIGMVSIHFENAGQLEKELSILIEI
ncbi:MAG: family hydrolase [Bacteroidetes bacterium]|jgi:2-haloacid dehalogenase|nr:family hydrolase [Bacteroidota bacterium]